jgi:photoactive yellow protein
MKFSDPDALASLHAMTSQELDELPFGVVAMTPAAIVTAYNAYEAEAAGFRPEDVLGRHFFREIAPCTNNYMVSGLYDFAGQVDQTIPYVFTLRMKPTRVNLRMLKSTDLGCQYLLVERTDPA